MAKGSVTRKLCVINTRVYLDAAAEVVDSYIESSV